MADEEKFKTLRFWSPNLIKIIGRIYPPAESIAQAVENEKDAQATKIWVVLESHQITVIGNGHGMFPYLLDEDQLTIDRAYEMLRQGKLPRGYDVRRDISDISLKSLDWMRQCIALSPKIPGRQKDNRGIRGIGAHAYFSYGDAAKIYTRPTYEMAVDYWGKGLKPTEGKVPTLVLILPSADGRLGETPIISEKPLTDPSGRELEHGSRLEVTQLREGIERDIKPSTLEAYLSRRFGDDIKNKKVEIHIIDKITAEGKRTYGKDILIQPLIYRGVPIIDQESNAPDSTPFSIYLNFDPHGKNRQLMVRRKRSEIFRLTELSEFQSEPWTLLSGYIDFPDYESDEDLWDSAKTSLLPSAKRAQWIKKLKSFTAQIEEAIQATESRFRQKGLDELSRDLVPVTINALSEIDYFRDRALLSPKKPPSGKGSGTNVAKAPTSVEVRVTNEHHIGIPGVVVKFTQNSNDLATKVTGQSGGISFGKPPEGKKYRVQMVVPEGTRPPGATFYDFDISSLQKGFKCRFQLITGAPKPPRSNLVSFDPWMRDFEDDPDQPWVQRLGAGIIEYNTLPDTELGSAIESNDEDLQWALFAEYTAAAFAEFFVNEESAKGLSSQLSFEERIAQLSTQKSLLYGKIYRQLRQTRQEYKRKRAAARRKK